MERLHGYALPLRANGDQVADANGETVAEFFESPDPNAYHGPMVQLFAAAPDLAAALKELLCWLGSGSALSNGAKCEMLTEATDQARAALHKAGVA